MSKEIILCQPDEKKGCAICCGLFNHQDISKKNLSHFLSNGTERCEIITEPEILDYDASLQKRDATTHICPYQGFLQPGKPGCLLHPAHIKKDLRDQSIYGSKLCDKFFCPAHKILSNNEKEILIKEIDDWYIYSIAIIDPQYFKELLKDFKIQGDEKTLKSYLYNALEQHAQTLQQKKEALFHYSLSEYKESKA
jgi:hypothetical protein